MLKYVLKRLALMALTFFVIVTVCFVLVKLLPSVPAEQFGKDAALIEARRKQLGYDKPILLQYFIFLRRSLFGFDYGISETLYRGREVWGIFLSKLPATVMVNAYAALISIPLGLLFGVFAALKKGKWQDGVISTGVTAFISVPSYVIAFLIQYVFSYKLGWLDFVLKDGTDWWSFSMFRSALPAVLALSFSTVAGLTRFTRAELCEAKTGEYMLLAKAKGLSKGKAIARHALRNAMVVVMPMIIGQIVGILAGSMIIEEIFSVPGVGQLYIRSITSEIPEYNLFMLLSAFYTLVGLLAGIVVDISYGFIDPRIRIGEK